MVTSQSLLELPRRARLEAQSLRALTRAGAFGLEPPRTTLQILKAMRGLGPFGGAVKVAALRFGAQPAITDERGTTTYADLDRQVDRLAIALRAKGLSPGDTVGILCRNHRVPLVVAFAASRAGLNCVWLNTSFSARQATEVAGREGVDLLVFDADLEEAIGGLSPRFGTLRSTPGGEGEDEVDALWATASGAALPAPKKPGRIILLTSGTTGTPKGAPRSEPKSLTIPGAVLERMPMRSQEATVIGPPLFHGTGLLITMVSIGLGNEIVLRRRFDAAQLLDDTARTGASTWCVVPIMLQRVLALGEEEVRRRDLSKLRVVFCAGSQLPADVALKAMDVLGDVVYNLYGSTEVSVATLATPADVRAAPHSVGRPALGVRIKLLDDQGREVPQGQVGRVFVGTTSPFEGYTGGGGKEVIDGLMSTGDVGHLDEGGRLHIDGRDDDMIVSGGENVFPREVEELLIAHPEVADAAALGVPDDDFGQRLRAFVVLRPGASLDEDAVKAHVKDNLARYKVPRDVVFLDELPRNPTGKVLKRELADHP